MIAGLIVTTALMIWKGLVLLTGSESPVSVYHFPAPRHYTPLLPASSDCMLALPQLSIDGSPVSAGFC